jgi:hypothetical protein
LRWWSCSCWRFLPGWPETMIFLITASQIAWDDKPLLLCPATSWDGVLGTICLGWPHTKLLPISAYCFHSRWWVSRQGCNSFCFK